MPKKRSAMLLTPGHRATCSCMLTATTVRLATGMPRTVRPYLHCHVSRTCAALARCIVRSSAQHPTSMECSKALRLLVLTLHWHDASQSQIGFAMPPRLRPLVGTALGHTSAAGSQAPRVLLLVGVALHEVGVERSEALDDAVHGVLRRQNRDAHVVRALRLQSTNGMSHNSELPRERKHPEKQTKQFRVPMQGTVGAPNGQDDAATARQDAVNKCVHMCAARLLEARAGDGNDAGVLEQLHAVEKVALLPLLLRRLVRGIRQVQARKDV